jgi:hypothetical protein
VLGTAAGLLFDLALMFVGIRLLRGLHIGTRPLRWPKGEKSSADRSDPN